MNVGKNSKQAFLIIYNFTLLKNYDQFHSDISPWHCGLPR